jgi:hydrogenase maturation factor HypF (carbamoyltransferase family)
VQKNNLKLSDPEHYALVKAAQEALKQECIGLMKIVRLCPYCEHKVQNIAKGQHGYAFSKCSRCGEEVIFPPVSFRRAK